MHAFAVSQLKVLLLFEEVQKMQLAVIILLDIDGLAPVRTG